MDEYIRLTRYVENGRVTIKEPLTNFEYVEFERVRTLELFNSDGLRSIIYTKPRIPNMKEKTLRYLGHFEYIKVIKGSRFLNTKKIDVNEVLISPLDATSKILLKEGKLCDREEELTVMGFL